MPTQCVHHPRRCPHAVWGLVAAWTVVCPGWAAESAYSPISIRTRQIEIDYQLSGSAGTTQVELWYTRDRGLTWQSAGVDTDGTSPFVFAAPSEGLYGFVLIAREGDRTSRPAPQRQDPAERWVFIDATPPLVQWDRVEPGDGFAEHRVLRLQWTAHDDHLTSRPIGLFYQSTVDQAWRVIANPIANTGRYDWTVPRDMAGQLTLKITVRDEGGQVVERLFGPVSLDRYPASPSTAEVAQSRPAAAAASTRPAGMAAMPRMGMSPGLLPDVPPVSTRPAARVDLLRQRMATDLYRKGSWYLLRGQHAVAAERFREALEQDPDLIEARQDLAGILYQQQEYDQALENYLGVLSRSANHEGALYGAALAYVAKKDYHQSREMLTRLLKANDHNAEAWLDLGDVLFMTGDIINARAHWRQAAKVDPAAREVMEKARRRLDIYGPADEVTSAGGSAGK